MVENCENCKFRAKYDQKPNSFLGRFWRWHINFCPGWKAYFTNLSEEKKAEWKSRAHLTPEGKATLTPENLLFLTPVKS